MVATFSTSASAFRCLARAPNGAATWGYGLIFERAQKFAMRHCVAAGGVGCHIVIAGRQRFRNVIRQR
jgi:hypothetical protein